MRTVVEKMTVCEQRRLKLPSHLNLNGSTEISPGLLQTHLGGGSGFQAREDSKILEINGTWIQESCHGETFPDIELKPLRNNKIYIQVNKKRERRRKIAIPNSRRIEDGFPMPSKLQPGSIDERKIIEFDCPNICKDRKSSLCLFSKL